MMVRVPSALMLASSVSLFIMGCMPKMSIEDMKAMRPRRPPELDKLNAFVGRWQWEGHGKIAGLDRPLRFTGERETQWEGDGWYLVTREVGNMEGLGESKLMAMWAYDARSRKFRLTWADSMGTIATGTARFDEKANTWHLRATSRSPSGTTVGRGRVRFPNPDTMEWDWTEYAMGGLRKTMELKGTCNRTP
ncbi:MAG: DUF1579 family protein [Phycisphaerae bacterium]